MSALRSLIERTTTVLLYIAAASTCLMMVHVSADVVSKLVFSQPLIGTLETVSLFYMVAAVFLPLAAVQRDRENVFIELFTQGLPEKIQRSLDILALVLMLALTLTLFWKGLDVAMKKTAVRELSTNIEFQVEVWPGRWLPVVGFAMTAAWCVLQIIEDLLFVTKDKPPSDQINLKIKGKRGL